MLTARIIMVTPRATMDQLSMPAPELITKSAKAPSTAAANPRNGGIWRRSFATVDLPWVTVRLGPRAYRWKPRATPARRGPLRWLGLVQWPEPGPAGTTRDRYNSWEEPIVSVSPATERTLVLIKPDAVRRGLIGEVLARFERKGLVIEALVLRTMDSAIADRHYAEHVDKPFYSSLKAFMTGGPLVAAILSGDQAIDVVRNLVGATDGRKAAGGTIRGDFSLSNQENLVHASDSPESARREIQIWFPNLA